jgi:hypothetical protein
MVLPLLAYAAVFAAGIAILAGYAKALPLLGAANIALIALGLRNAWDLVIFTARKTAEDALAPASDRDRHVHREQHEVDDDVAGLVQPRMRAGCADHDDAEPDRGERREPLDDAGRPRRDEPGGAEQLADRDDADERERIVAYPGLSHL